MPSRLPALTTMLILLACTMAHAADPALKAGEKKGNVLSLGSGKPAGKLLTRDQLRQCLASQQTLKQRDGEAAKAQAELDADKAAITELDADLAQQAAALQTERAAIDTSNEAAVAAFNAKLAARAEREAQRNQKVDGYNAKLAPFNAQVQAVNQTRQGWQADCADRAYDEADYFAIQRGK